MTNGNYERRPQRPRNAVYTQARRPIKRRRRNRRGCVTLTVAFVCVIAAVFILYKIIGGGDNKQTSSTDTQQNAAQQEEKAREYNIPPASEQNDLLKIAREAQGSGDRKICYLTFDDGPTKEVTPKVLEVLKKYDVKATFFCLGKMLAANRELAEQEHRE